MIFRISAPKLILISFETLDKKKCVGQCYLSRMEYFSIVPKNTKKDIDFILDELQKMLGCNDVLKSSVLPTFYKDSKHLVKYNAE